MDLKFQIGFIIGFLLMSLICMTTDGFADYSPKTKNYEEMAELYAKSLDYTLDDIRSQTKRTCIRGNLVDVYSEKLKLKDKCDTLQDEVTNSHHMISALLHNISNLKDDKLELQRTISDLKDDKLDLVQTISDLKANVTFLNNSLMDCMVCVHKLSVRLYVEIVERNGFPGWLVNADLDRYERWLFALYFVYGINMNRVRESWEKFCVEAKKGCTLEYLAAAMYRLYEDVSETVAHGENKLTMKPKGEKLDLACKKVAGDDFAKDLACRTVWTIQIDVSEESQREASDGSHSIYYGKLLCKNLVIGEQRLNELFSNGTAETVQACQVKSKVIDVSFHPAVVAKKPGVSKRNFIGFSAKCPKLVTPTMFREYVLDDQMKSGIKRDHENQAATLVIYEDIYNPPTYVLPKIEQAEV